MQNNLFIMGCCLFISACSPVELQIKEQYRLSSLQSHHAAHRVPYTILVTQPEAVAGYQTEQMLYVKKPYELNHFAHNGWISSPPNMLYPLMVTSLQHSHYFAAVVSGSFADKTDYRVDTLILMFQQNFLGKPSHFEFTAKVVLSHVEDARAIASKMIALKIPCTEDTPYAGVVAANKATQQFTGLLTQFVMQHIETDQKSDRIPQR